MPRYLIHQQDGNARAIVELWQAHGATYQQIDQPCDGLLSFRGVTAVIEIKQPKAKLRPKQQAFFDRWPGLKRIIRTEQEAVELLEVMRVMGKMMAHGA